MLRFNYIFNVIIITTLTNLLLVESPIAQPRSKKSSEVSYHKSISSKSIPNSSLNSKKYNNYNKYEPTSRNISDSYIKNDKITRKNSEESQNYFRVDKSGNSLWDGKHWEQDRFPLKVYVKESYSRYYKSAYKNYVKYALNVWRKADDRIQYNFVNSIDDADIALIFVENLGDRYEENYLGLTDYETGKRKRIEYSKIEISLLKNGNEKVSAGEIKATIIHELGHAFGLGHSDNKNDLMYPYISPQHSSEMNYDELSNGDKLAIKDLLDLSFEDVYVWK